MLQNYEINILTKIYESIKIEDFEDTIELLNQVYKRKINKTVKNTNDSNKILNQDENKFLNNL